MRLQMVQIYVELIRSGNKGTIIFGHKFVKYVLKLQPCSLQLKRPRCAQPILSCRRKVLVRKWIWAYGMHSFDRFRTNPETKQLYTVSIHADVE